MYQFTKDMYCNGDPREFNFTAPTIESMLQKELNEQFIKQEMELMWGNQEGYNYHFDVFQIHKRFLSKTLKLVGL